MPYPTGVSLDPRILGTLSQQDSSNVNITGGSITDVTVTSLTFTGTHTLTGATLTGGTFASPVLSGTVTAVGTTINGGTYTSATINSSTIGATSTVNQATIDLKPYTVAGLPAASSSTGHIVSCTDGDAGSPCVAFSDGSNWKVIALGATVST